MKKKTRIHALLQDFDCGDLSQGLKKAAADSIIGEAFARKSADILCPSYYLSPTFKYITTYLNVQYIKRYVRIIGRGRVHEFLSLFSTFSTPGTCVDCSE